MRRALILLIGILGLLNSGLKGSIRNTMVMESNGEVTKSAVFAGGCFWCTEAIFSQLKGVKTVVSGYTGGTVVNPTYKDVCTGTTGHAECTIITYDPQQVAFSELLEVFWATHDPTTLNRQGADSGTQYRSAIFYTDETQKEEAIAFKQKLEDAKIWNDPIVTEITRFEKFYPAEDYHQSYYINNTNQGYCRIVITPKVEKFKKIFANKLKTKK
jgi:peptide-methionine (S)-S-oxide reductase